MEIQLEVNIMKKFLALCLMGVMLFAITGCGEEEKDVVQDDLIQYVETDLPTIKGDEATAVNRYNEVSAGIADMDRKTILSAFNDEIIPSYTTFYNNLMNLSVATEEVKALKETYVEGAKLQLEGMTALSKAIQDNDSEAAQAANEQIAQGKTKIEQHRSDITKLASEHNISIKTADSTQAEATTEAAE